MKKRWALGILSVLFGVVLAVLYGAFTGFKLIDEKKTARARIMVTHKRGLGEREMAERIRKTAINMDMECSVLTLSRISRFKSIAKHLTYLFVDSFDPEIIISLEGGRHIFSDAKKYVALTHGSEYYFSEHSNLPFELISHYDGFLVAFPDKGTLKSYFACSEKKCNYLKWYTTCQSTEFLPPSNFDLFYCGSNMANTSYGTIFKSLFSLLDQAGYLNIYGGKEMWLHTPKSYRGFIKHDGSSILTTMHQKGVSLILHAPDHFLGDTPNGRIFEAAAASSVIISDKHPFVVENFGDSVLYVDHDSGNVMFEQVNNHMKWIRNNPDKARELARRSHAIFSENFTLEKQLSDLIELNKNITDKRYVENL